MRALVPPSHIVIAGGGLAGLSCAHELGAGFTLLEAQDRVGGLARTEVVQGFSFDVAGHWLHARDPEVRSLVEDRWLRGNLLTIERRALVHSEGVWTEFPYQHNLHGLPARTVAECLIGFVEATEGEKGRALRERPLRNAAEFIQRHLGDGFARRFLLPYNRKLFTVPCEELSPEWGGRFIPRPTLEEVVRGALGIAPGGAGYNATFWYPREGGIEALPRAIAQDLRGGEVRVRSPVAAIDLAARRVRLASGEEIPYGQLVFTLPLSSIAKLISGPADVLEAAGKLRAVSVTVVEIGADDVGGRRFHWAYFPEERFRFYRVGSPSEANPLLAPEGQRSFSVEFSHRGPIDAEPLAAHAVASLHELGLIDRARVRLLRSRTIPVAYVLFDHEHAQAREQVIAHLRRNGVHVAGRYASWEYSSMEDAILSGRRVARALHA
ncbi:MAG TPA: FAD-dependent oxidoreductase [Myxococcales bacterium]|nr:FAD-dependent oxidoreductase [Myxococcales bacterium]